MGHGRGAGGAARRGRARHGSRRETLSLRQTRVQEREFRRAGQAIVTGAPGRVAEYARLVLVPAIWGGTFVAGKYVVMFMSALVGSFSRYVIACGALVIAAFVLEKG